MAWGLKLLSMVTLIVRNGLLIPIFKGVVVQGVAAFAIKLVVLSPQGFAFFDDDFRDAIKATKEAWHVVAQVDQQACIVSGLLPANMHRMVAPRCIMSLGVCVAVDDRMGYQTMFWVIPHQIVHGLRLRLVIDPYVHRHIAAQRFQTEPAGEAQASIQIFVR